MSFVYLGYLAFFAGEVVYKLVSLGGVYNAGKTYPNRRLSPLRCAPVVTMRFFFPSQTKLNTMRSSGQSEFRLCHSLGCSTQG